MEIEWENSNKSTNYKEMGIYFNPVTIIEDGEVNLSEIPIWNDMEFLNIQYGFS